MITIDGKTYRNLQQQVKKNQDDIKDLKGSGITVSGESINNVTNDTSTIVKHLATNNNIEYMLSTPTANKINNSLQLPNTEINYTQLVGIGTNKSQANIEIDTATLKIENNKLSAITSGTGGVTKDYVDSQDSKLQNQITTTDNTVQALNEEVATIKTDTIPAMNTNIANKLDKMTSAGSGVKAYIHQDGVDRLLSTSTDVTRNLIVRWDNSGRLHSNTATTGDEVVNYEQWASQSDDFKANIDLKANLTDNTFTGIQTISNDLEGALIFNKTSVTPFTELFKLTYTAGENSVTEAFRVPMTTENALHYLITSKTINNGSGLNYDRNTNSLTVGHKITFTSDMTVTYVTANGESDTLTTTTSTPIVNVVAMKITAAAGLNMTGCALDVAGSKLLINESSLEQMTDKELIPLTDIIYR